MASFSAMRDDVSSSGALDAWQAVRAAAQAAEQAEEDLEKSVAGPRTFRRRRREEAAASRREAVANAEAAYNEAVSAYARSDPTLSALVDELVMALAEARVVNAELAPLTEKLNKAIARLQASRSPDPRTVRATQARSEHGRPIVVVALASSHVLIAS